ncbi:MAG TPA: alanine--tRNA ligase [Dehalococcoidia bacterium]|nr:alanine--tRNA ligase [Dehalococcoidia bacterium]
MTSDEIRRLFTEFFVHHGHTPVPSASLVPFGDPTLLFTNAGMNQFKPYFMGLAEPPYPRATTIQKCFRTTDIDDVGDASHLTFFEMMGNFSFGDYFKAEAVGYAWELLTKEVGLPPERLRATIYLDDEEAYAAWRGLGVPAERIHRYGEEFNYWFSGPTGPCGPDSEIFFDFGPVEGCRFCETGACEPHPQGNADLECGRFLEIWNLVFMQLYQDEDGSRRPLPRKNIDTGAGLERWAAMLGWIEARRPDGDIPNVYETDLFRPIIAQVEGLTGRSYGAEAAVTRAIRVVAEHARAATFLIGDGVLPSNEGRGYVLRRLMRRAVYFMTRLRGGSAADAEPSLHRVARAVIDRMRAAYPDLGERGDFIERVWSSEETRFLETIERGEQLLGEVIERVRSSGGDRVPGDQAFLLHDTYGFPIELTRELAAERGLAVDEEGFEREMERQRERARAAAKFEYEDERIQAYARLSHIRTRFVGYDRTRHDTTVAAIVTPAGVVDAAEAGQEVELVLLETPFYPEGGGQVGDQGEVRGPAGRVVVEDTQAVAEGLIASRGRVVEGRIAVNDAVTATVDEAKRAATMRNHTATHLLHAALRQILGTHVRQSGSLVAPDRLRFDFTHFEPVRPEELEAVERLVNEKIRADVEVHPHETTYRQAIEEGAIALFGEKYAERVRVVAICEPAADRCFSKELCGGTHCHRTGEIGSFVIVSESGIGAGLRRIEALTGEGAVRWIRERLNALEAAARALNTAPAELPGRIEGLQRELEETRRRLEALQRAQARDIAASLVERRRQVNGVSLVAEVVPATSAEALRDMGDYVRAKLGAGSAVILAADVGGRPQFVAIATPEAVAAGFDAGAIIRAAAKVTGGGGGGRPDMAQAGGRDVAKLAEAVAVAVKEVEKALGASST